jgi:hypothetical protein
MRMRQMSHGPSRCAGQAVTAVAASNGGVPCSRHAAEWVLGGSSDEIGAGARAASRRAGLVKVASDPAEQLWAAAVLRAGCGPGRRPAGRRHASGQPAEETSEPGVWSRVCPQGVWACVHRSVALPVGRSGAGLAAAGGADARDARWGRSMRTHAGDARSGIETGGPR